MNGYGFKEVYNLKGGIKGWQGHKAAGPEELNLDLVRGDETPAQIAALAIGMEESLKQFYQTLAQNPGRARQQLFAKMVEVSELHKQNLLSFTADGTGGQDLAAFDSAIVPSTGRRL